MRRRDMKTSAHQVKFQERASSQWKMSRYRASAENAAPPLDLMTDTDIQTQSLSKGETFCAQSLS